LREGSAGWHDFESIRELVIDVPAGEVLLAREVVSAIHEFAKLEEGMVRLVPDPHSGEASVRGVDRTLAGRVCTECFDAPERADWDMAAWFRFIAGASH
jgi:hypothetical protein